MDIFIPSLVGRQDASSPSPIDFSSSTLILVRASPGGRATSAHVGRNASVPRADPHLPHPHAYAQPIVSLANVSQLCSDLLIHTLGLQSVGALSGRYSIPVAVPADYVDDATDGQASTSRNPGLSTAIEGASVAPVLLLAIRLWLTVRPCLHHPRITLWRSLPVAGCITHAHPAALSSSEGTRRDREGFAG